MKEVRLDIYSIRAEDRAQTRARFDDGRAREYAEDLKAGASFPAGVVFRDDEGNLWLSDGFHRLEAHKLADKDRPGMGYERMLFEVRPGTLDDAIRHSAGSNATHGIPRTNEDRRRACRAYLGTLSPDELADMTGRRLGDLVKVSHVFANQELAAFRDPDLAGKMATSGESARQLRREQEQQIEPLDQGRAAGELIMDQAVWELVRHLPMADDAEQREQLARLPHAQAFDVAELLYTGQAESVTEALLLLEQRDPVHRLATSSQSGNPPAPADEPQQMSLLADESGTLSSAMAESYGKPAAGPYLIFNSQDEFLAAARHAVQKAKRESANNDEWVTPDELIAAIVSRFGARFTLDVAATPETAKAPRFFSKDDSALTQSWARRPDLGDDGDAWMNHPYTLTAEFMAKAFQAALSGERTSYCLPKADTDRAWWWEHARYAEVWFLPGRVTYSNASSGAMFPNALVIFRDTMGQPGYKPSTGYFDYKGASQELPIAASSAIKQGGVVLDDRVYFQQPADFEDPGAPLIWVPYRAAESPCKGKRRAG